MKPIKEKVLRYPMDIHRELMILAAQEGKDLNEFISDMLIEKVKKSKK